MVTARRSFNISDILEPEKDLVAQLQRTHNLNLTVSPDKSSPLTPTSPSFPSSISVGKDNFNEDILSHDAEKCSERF